MLRQILRGLIVPVVFGVAATGGAKGGPITITVTGTVSNGLDFSGVFVSPNSSLTGQAFTLIYTFDDSKGQQSVQADGTGEYGTSISGDNAASPGTAMLTINNNSFTVGTFPGKYSVTTVTSSATRDVSTSTQLQNQLQENVTEYYTGVPNSGAESYVDSIVGTVNYDPAITTDPNWEDNLTHILNSREQYASTGSGFLIRDETNLPDYTFAYGSLLENTITVSGHSPESSVPEPANMVLSGLVLLVLRIYFKSCRHVTACSWRLRRKLGPGPLFALVAIGVSAVGPGVAQEKGDFAGDYVGTLGRLHVNLHIVAGPNGSLSANVDSPDQNLFAVACADIGTNGRTLSFSVPNVRGEWMGTLSADRLSLSGIWKQGGPMPLNFTRKGASPPPDNTSPSSLPLPTDKSAPTATTVLHHPPCNSVMNINYWDGSEWKPMTRSSHMGGEHGISLRNALKDPLIYRAGITKIVIFSGPVANLTLETRPSFCVSVLPGYDPTVIMIGRIDEKKDHRELETCAGACASKGRNSDDWMPANRAQPVLTKRLSDRAVEITPKSPLPAGQYMLGGPGVIAGYYDFGVGSGALQ